MAYHICLVVYTIYFGFISHCNFKVSTYYFSIHFSSIATEIASPPNKYAENSRAVIKIGFLIVFKVCFRNDRGFKELADQKENLYPQNWETVCFEKLLKNEHFFSE